VRKKYALVKFNHEKLYLCTQKNKRAVFLLAVKYRNSTMSISKTRSLLVDVARHLFAKKGLEGTTMNDIAVASNKGRRTLYTYFNNKEEIYYAVIETEMERLSDRMDEVASKNMDSDQKVILLVYTHLNMIKEAVTRNGNLRAEFFRNIWMVERVRKTFDHDELELFQRVLQEGCDKGIFCIENVPLMADIFHYALKGLEVPYIYGRLAKGITLEESRPVVVKFVRRLLGMIQNSY
jgi:AcrR family transcriptional regulator